MSSIACQVGGSKSTLWTYFPSKETLFAAVVDDIVDHYGETLSIELPLDEDVFTVLHRYADVLMGMLLSEQVIALHRLVIGEAQRFPYLAELYYDRGPRRGKRRLADYFQAVMTRGKLRSGDPVIAVQQFVGLCQCGVYQKSLLGLDKGHDARQLANDVQMAVESFRHAWGPKHPS